MTLSKNKIKFIQSLNQKKYRKEHNCFVAEGAKLVNDILPYFKCLTLMATETRMAENPGVEAGELIIATREEIKKVSFLTTPQDVVGVFELPTYNIEPDNLKQQLVIALDTIQDPGNLGTIVRIADWFGIEHIICSPDTVDVFNPKTVQATMGAIARVKVIYTPLPEFLTSMKGAKIYGTFLEGYNIYNETLSKEGIIIMGNEGKGISPELQRFITDKLFIPSYPPARETSESLNVAIATSIVCSEFRRR